MKILQVGLGNNPGGMEAFVMNYFRELARQGVSFDLYLCMERLLMRKKSWSLVDGFFMFPM